MFPNLTKDEIAIAGCSMELMNPLCREFLGFEASAQIDKNKKYKVILCDEVGEEVSSKDLKADCICYLNTNHDYRFADDIKQGFENIHYLNVLVRQTKENAIGKDQEHAIFVNTKDQEIVDKLERFLYVMSSSTQESKCLLEMHLWHKSNICRSCQKSYGQNRCRRETQIKRFS